MTDEITLTMPRERRFYRVAHLVLGGLAARHDVTLEHLDDLQLAVAGLLDGPAGEGDVTLRLRVEGDRVHAAVGPFDDTVRGELEREAQGQLGLRRLLETVVDEVELGEGDRGHWVALTKAVRTGAQ